MQAPWSDRQSFLPQALWLDVGKNFLAKARLTADTAGGDFTAMAIESLK